MKLPEPDLVLLNDALDQLPSASQKRILSFRSKKDRWRILLSDLLRRKILSEELSISLNDVEIERDAYNKPFIVGRKREFNLSYSEDYILFATDERAIGVDIECIRPLNDLDDLVKASFSIEEQHVFKAKKREEQLDYFYDLWTLKESYIKAIGKGIACDLHSFTLSENSLQKDQWYFQRYTSLHPYKIALCAQHPFFPKEPKTLSASDLII